MIKRLLLFACILFSVEAFGQNTEYFSDKQLKNRSAQKTAKYERTVFKNPEGNIVTEIKDLQNG